MDIKLSKTKWYKVIQSRGFPSKTLGTLGKTILLGLAVPLGEDV